MFKETKYQKTEQEALEQERAEQNWQKIYGCKADGYIDIMDQLLDPATPFLPGRA